MPLLLPSWVEENVAREEFVDARIDFARRYEREVLKPHDHRLSLVFVKPTEQAKQLGLRPGRWHVRRRNDGLPDSYMAVTTPNGGYREPDSSLLDEIRRRDLWVTPKPTRIQQEMEERNRRSRDLRSEQMRDEYAADFRAARRVPGETLDKRRWATGKGKK